MKKRVVDLKLTKQMVTENQYNDQVLDTCLKAGRLMIESGSEMYRVEDTMLRISRNANIPAARCFTTPTGLFMSLGEHSKTQMTLIKNRNIDMTVVDKVNELSRAFADKKITLDQLHNKLCDLADHRQTFSNLMQIFGATILSCTLMVLFMDDYDWIDFPVAAIVGGSCYGIYLWIKKYSRVRFLGELVTAMIMGAITICICHIFPSLSMDNILIGSLMALVPGVPITNALSDLFRGDLVSGTVRAIEAFLTAVALGGGIGLAIKFLGGF